MIAPTMEAQTESHIRMCFLPGLHLYKRRPSHAIYEVEDNTRRRCSEHVSDRPPFIQKRAANCEDTRRRDITAKI